MKVEVFQEVECGDKVFLCDGLVNVDYIMEDDGEVTIDNLSYEDMEVSWRDQPIVGKPRQKLLDYLDQDLREDDVEIMEKVYESLIQHERSLQ